MALVTVSEITNLYLYGIKSTPPDKVDAALIRLNPLPDPIPVKVNASEYMQGPGRFALAANSDLVKKFFTAPDIPGYTLGQKLSLNKTDMADLLGIDSYGIEFNQYNYEDGQDDFAERVYIWNSTSCRLNDEAVFVIEADGTRHIENLSVVPWVKTIPENFDFEGGGLLTQLGNDLILEDRVDPFRIGRTVEFEFTEISSVPTDSFYDYQDYQAELAQEDATYSVFNRFKTYSAMESVTDHLWETGVTKFLDDQERPIVYGTMDNDELTAYNSVWAHSQFIPYRLNGAVLIGGDGNDKLTGSDGSDHLYESSPKSFSPHRAVFSLAA